MQNWASNYQKILEDSDEYTRLLAGYVDDGRQSAEMFTTKF